MKDFPRWLLVLAFICIVPVFVCPLYLFGGLRLFSPSGYAVVDFLLYITQNLVWLTPILCFFGGLDLHRRGFERAGVAVIGLGVALTALSVALLFV